MEKVNQSYIYGLVKLMIEAHLQFDLVEQEQEWERYQLVVIPDELMPDGKTVERLHQYVEKGGALIVCDRGGLQPETGQSWLERYGIQYRGQSPFKPAYFVAGDHFVKNTPGYAYALYHGASQWSIQTPARSLAQLGEPLFQRSAEHYTSHKQSPFDHETDYSVMAISGKTGLIGFPVGNSYYAKGYWIYREAFMHLVNEFVPRKLVETNAPLSTEVTVTYQEANEASDRPERYMVHLINWSPVRKTPGHPEMHEDVVPLTDVHVKLNIPFRNVLITTVASREKLKHRMVDQYIEVTVPKISSHEIICFERS